MISQTYHQCKTRPFPGRINLVKLLLKIRTDDNEYIYLPENPEQPLPPLDNMVIKVSRRSSPGASPDYGCLQEKCLRKRLSVHKLCPEGIRHCGDIFIRFVNFAV